MTKDRSLAGPKSPASEGEGFRYAVIDLAVADTLQDVIGRCLPAVAQTLFSTSFPLELLNAGPWLVRLSEAPEVEEALARMTPDTPWGYFIHTTVDIISLRHTLRRFNLVELPDPPREVLFRYWDPRVIRMFLNIATPHQLDRFFDFIDRIEFSDGTLDFAAPRRD